MALLDKLKSRSKEQAAEASDGASAPTQSSLASSLLSKLKMKPSADDGKADKAYDPLRTVSILDRIRPQTEGGASRPLPLIGHLPARRQIEICLYTMLIFIALFAITTVHDGALIRPRCGLPCHLDRNADVLAADGTFVRPGYSG